MPQSFEKHVHRPTLTVVGYLFAFVAMTAFAFRWTGAGGGTAFALGLLAVLGALITLLRISRSYTTRLQDRIIKLEMLVRTASLLTPDQQRTLLQLTNKQIAALRFASDAELPALIDRAARERLAPSDIKRAIKTWIPDLDRT
jgi:Family of unknown function (DUF6526)